MRNLKTTAILIALLVVIVGAVGLWSAGWVMVNRLAVRPIALETGKTTTEGGRKGVTLFFVARDDHSFREENREIESVATTTEDAKRTVAELVKGPQSANAAPTVPREAKLLNLFIDPSGTAYVDFNQGLRDGLPGGAQEELYTVFSIVNTLTSNFARIKRVQILIEGAEIPTLAGHVDTRTALPPQYVF